jgi:hypothetical protein
MEGGKEEPATGEMTSLPLPLPSPGRRRSRREDAVDAVARKTPPLLSPGRCRRCYCQEDAAQVRLPILRRRDGGPRGRRRRQHEDLGPQLFAPPVVRPSALRPRCRRRPEARGGARCGAG